MKTNILAIASLIASLTFSSAAEKVKAPNGGRIISTVTPNAEFVITAEKKVEIRFLDETGKVIAPASQTASVVMGDRANPTKLAFTKDGDKLVSDKAVPEGKDLPVVLQIRAKDGDKAVTEKFNLNLSNCPTCSHAEYACSCDHAAEEKAPSHGPGDGHDH